MLKTLSDFRNIVSHSRKVAIVKLEYNFNQQFSPDLSPEFTFNLTLGLTLYSIQFFMLSAVENITAHPGSQGTGACGSLSQVLLEQMPGAVALLDRDMKYLGVNQRWIREFSLENLPVVGTSHYVLFPDLHSDWRQLYECCLAGQRHTSEPDVHVRRDGSRTSTRWEIDPWQGPDGEIAGLLMQSRVVESQSDPQEEAASSELGRALLHLQDRPVVLLDAAGRIRRANDAARGMAQAAGGTLTEQVSFFWNALYPASRRETARSRIQTLLSPANLVRANGWQEGGADLALLESPHGEVHWSAIPGRSEDAAPEGLLLVGAPFSINHMSESQSTQRPIQDNEYRQFAEAAPFGMIVLTEDAELVYANPQHRLALGFSVEECGGISAWLERGCAAEEDQRKQAMDDWWERVWRRRAPLTCSMRNNDGILKEIEFRPAPLPDHRLLLTVFDVTDARLEEQTLRASEARYHGLFQNCAAGVVVLNGSGNISEINPVFETLTGCSRMDVRRNGLAAFLPARDAARVRDAAAGGASSGEILTEIKARDGTVTPVNLSLSVVKNDVGTPVYTACFLYPRPVASAQDWLGSSCGLASPDLLLMLDSDARILQHSAARDFATALPGGSLAGRSLQDLLPDAAELLPLDVMIERLIENPAAETRCEFTIPSPSGRQRFIEARMVPLPDAASSARYGLALRDLSTAIDNQKKATPTVANPLPWLRNLQTPVIVTNERGRITGLNPAAESLTGWSQEDLQGSGLYKLFMPENPKVFGDTISRELSTNRRWTDTVTLHCRDHTTRCVEVDLVPAVDESSGGRGFITLLTIPAEKPVPPPEAPAAPARPSVSLHRARNDLQVLASLLTLQADRKGGDPAARAELIAGKDRLSAVSIIYRLISSEEDTVDFSRYVQELGRTLLENHQIRPEMFKIETSFDSIRLPQKLSITLGLILEELINLAISDAFPTNAGGVIRIALTIGGGEGVLIIRDNGELLTEALRTRRLGSFSWHIVETLSSQLGGTLTLLSDLENQVRLRFRLP